MNLIASKHVQETRYDICKKCDRLTMIKTCKECGCIMPLKVKIPSASCPLGKWIATTSTEEEKPVNMTGTWGNPQNAECCTKYD